MFIVEDIRSTFYRVLSQDAQLTAHGLVGVFPSQAPDDTVFPYITYGDEVYVPFLTFGNLGYEVTMMLHLWDIDKGGDTYFLLVADIYRLLHHPTGGLPLSTYKPVDSEIEWMSALDIPRERARNLVMRVKLKQQA